MARYSAVKLNREGMGPLIVLYHVADIFQTSPALLVAAVEQSAHNSPKHTETVISAEWLEDADSYADDPRVIGISMIGSIAALDMETATDDPSLPRGDDAFDPLDGDEDDINAMVVNGELDDAEGR